MAEGMSLSRQGGAEQFLPGWFLQSSGLSLEFYLASTRSEISRDKVWEPRAILIPCWYAVSVIYTAVENRRSSCRAARLMLIGLEHSSSWRSQKREPRFCCSSFLFGNVFKKSFVWRPLKQTRDLLLYNCPLP